MAKSTPGGLGSGGEDGFGAAPHERPVPRISIQAFCEFPDTGAALQRAAADRRLAKAHVTVQLGGIQAAVDHHAGNPTPNLLIVETRLQGKTAVEEIDRLADVCDPATKVVIVGRVNDVELYRELMRRGVSEVVCEELCGQGHYKMRGEIIMVSKAQYRHFIMKEPPTPAGGTPGTQPASPPPVAMYEPQASATASAPR